MSLVPSTSSLAPSSNTYTGGASQQICGLNTERNGLLVTVDTAATASVYLLLGAGTASATNFHIVLSAGGSWDGRISGALWEGPVQMFSTASGKVGVLEV